MTRFQCLHPCIFWQNHFLPFLSQKLKDEIKQLRRELVSNSKQKKDEEQSKVNEEVKKTEELEVVQRYKEDVDKYVHLKRKKLMNEKESKTLELLNSFRERLFNAKQSVDRAQPAADEAPNPSENDSLNSILTHKLELDEEVQQKVIDEITSDFFRFRKKAVGWINHNSISSLCCFFSKVIDANIADNERFSIFDPRNTLNVRKREISKEIIKDRKKHAKHY